MKMKRCFIPLSLFICMLLLTTNVFVINATTNTGEEFNSFLKQFTNSAAFQLSRIKFPLKTPIILLSSDGETEKKFPFTQEKWPLLDESAFIEERMEDEFGAIYVCQYVINEPHRKVFESGYEESEIDMRVEFVVIDGKWFVIDGYTGWYGFDLPAEELNEAVKLVQEDNKLFIEIHP